MVSAAVQRRARGSRRRITVSGLVLVALVFALSACTPTPAIAGTVTNSSGGAPVKGTEVAVYADTAETLVKRTFTDATGKYDIGGLAPGSYRIRMSDAAWYPGASSWATASTIQVVANQTTTVDAVISPATGRLSGTVSSAGGGGLAGATVTVLNAETGDAIAASTTNASGGYIFLTLSSAPYRVRFSKTGFGTAFAGGAVTFSTAQTFTVSTGVLTSGVSGSVALQATLAGRVTNGHVGVGGLAVMALSGTEIVGGATTDADGFFIVTNLPAATYQLQVLDLSTSYRGEYWGTTSLTTPGQSPTFELSAEEAVDVGTNIVAGKDCDPAVLFPGANLAAADLHDKALAGCWLPNTNLTGANLLGANLTGANLSGANVAAANLTGATIRGAVLTEATGLPTTVGLTTTAVNGWNNTSFFDSDLSLVGADLSGADLSGVVMAKPFFLAGMDLSGADLSDTNLTNALFFGANLRGTDISGANLAGASLIFSMDTPIGFADAQYDNTVCPTFQNSNDVGDTCAGEPWMCAPASCLPADHCLSITPVPWWGDVVRESVTFPGTIDPVLGTIFRPSDITTYPGARPVVAILPGYNETECYQWWSAWSLAAHGYVTITFTPTIPATSEPDLSAAIDFLGSPANPFAAFTDASRLGIIGHSSGAAHVSHLQDVDLRVDTAIAWDILNPTFNPRVPALGMSSDEWIGAGPPPGPADGKLAGANLWRLSGLPTGELTIADSLHGDFQSNGNPAAHPRIFLPTLAWLDRWLLDDPTAIDRIASPTWNGEPRIDALSAYYTSIFSTPEYTCLDLETC